MDPNQTIESEPPEILLVLGGGMCVLPPNEVPVPTYYDARPIRSRVVEELTGRDPFAGPIGTTALDLLQGHLDRNVVIETLRYCRPIADWCRYADRYSRGRFTMAVLDPWDGRVLPRDGTDHAGLMRWGRRPWGLGHRRPWRPRRRLPTRTPNRRGR